MLFLGTSKNEPRDTLTTMIPTPASNPLHLREEKTYAVGQKVRLEKNSLLRHEWKESVKSGRRLEIRGKRYTQARSAHLSQAIATT